MEVSWLITAILGFIVLYFAYWLSKVNSDYWKKRGVPQIESSPLVGSMLDLVLKKKSFDEIIVDFYKRFDGEKIVGYFQFISPMLIVRDPELINHILIKDFTHFEDRQPPAEDVKDLFTLNLGILTGEKWRNARHKVTPTFTSGKMKMMLGPIKECSDELVHYLQDKTDEDIDVRQVILKTVFNIIGNVAFGLKLDVLNEKDEQSKQFYKHSSAFFKPSFLNEIKLMISFTTPKLKQILKFKSVDNNVASFFRNLTADIVKHREDSGARRNDFLQLMLDLKKKEKESLLNGKISDVVPSYESETIDAEDKELMDQLKNTPTGFNKDSSNTETFTEEFIAAQTFLFISAGSETVASVLSFVLYEMAVNQDLQRKVQDEISSVLSSQEFNYQAIKKMTYLEQFINETQRMHPVASGLFRFCVKDYKIPGTEVIVEKGMTVNIPVIGLHMDPQYFSEPEKFNPDRFKDVDAVPKNVYLPFGGGPRICIAMRLAMLEMKIMLATLLLKYNVLLSKKTKLPLKMKKNSISVQAEGGVWLKFKNREV